MKLLAGGVLALLIPILLGAGVPAFAQHEGHGGMTSMPPSAPPEAEPTPFQSDMSAMVGMTPRDSMHDSAMPHWLWMNMGVARLVYNRQGGDSGEDAVESSNWNMVMAHRPLGHGRLTFMLMNSLEPATISEHGSPQLFQTGESFEGKPLVDHQHAHDFFMNLSATYRRALAPDAALWIQLAAVGEPALGPTAFMHRASSGENPSAPLGHHWQDSSHITRSVVTAGGGWKWLVLEASAFHGEEPDENRWNIDGGGLDSFSGRLKLLINHGWSAQISHAYLHNLEALEEGDTHRTVASIGFGAMGDRPIAATFIWGRNREEHGTSNALLAEAAWQLTRVDQTFARLEHVEKDAELLASKRLPGTGPPSWPPAPSAGLADLTALTLGYLHDFNLLHSLATGLGGDVTLYGVPSNLEAVYGDFPVSVHVLARLRWGEGHGMGGHGGDEGGEHHGHHGM